MNREIETVIWEDLSRKMVFVTGPRQAGKTTLARHLLARLEGGQYFNYDVLEDRQILMAERMNRLAPMWVFDELHKMPNWKQWLKGVGDGRPEGLKILVTGSARMDTFRQGGESLAGRYVHHHLHPITVAELCKQANYNPQEALALVLARGGFPEPLFSESENAAKRWRNLYFEGMVRDDVLEFSRLHEIKAMQEFAHILRMRVGSPLSLASIARDLHLAPMTLKRYLEILEALHIVFIVRPWSKAIARATQLSPKVYFYDTGLVLGDDGVRFENLVATALLAQRDYRQDQLGEQAELHYIRTKDGAEVDFCLSTGGELTDLIECKLADSKPHRALLRFAGEMPEVKAYQVVRDLRHEQHFNPRLSITPAAPWLASL